MGNNSSPKDKFLIAEDGTIKRFANAIDDDPYGLGLLCFAVDAGMYYIVAKFLVKKLSNISQTIRSVKYNY